MLRRVLNGRVPSVSGHVPHCPPKSSWMPWLDAIVCFVQSIVALLVLCQTTQ